MQKAVTGALVLLALFLAALNTRLQERERILQDRLARIESKARRTPKAPVAATPEPEAPASVVASSEPAPVTAKPQAPPAPIVPVVQPAVATDPGSLAFFDSKLTFTLRATTQEIENADGDAALGLTPSQKTAIDALRKQRDATTKDYEDQIKRISDETERNIRGMLTPEQLAKYDADRSPTKDAIVQTTEEVVEPSGRKPGYLGISGGDADGGGARITEVFENTVASGLGLQRHDVILEFNGEPIANLAALAAKIREAGAGSPASIRIRRGASEFTQGLQLGGWTK